MRSTVDFNVRALAAGSAFSCSDGYGWDIGINAFAGQSLVWDATEDKCECEKK